MLPGEKPAASAYRVDDRELLLGFYFRIFWRPLGDCIPKWVAPNAITVLAQILILLATLFAYLAGVGSHWYFLLSSLCLALYLTADNLDGYHARRTGQCSNLGELLDHGLDGIASGATLLTTAYTLDVHGPWLVLLCAVGALAWLVTFWEQYVRGELVIARIGATEAFTLLIGLQLTLLVLGAPAWLRFDERSFTVGTLIIGASVVGYLWPIVPPIWRVGNPSRTLRELLPLVVYSQLGLCLSGRSPLFAAIVVSVVSADLVCRLIRKRLGQPLPLLGPLDLPLVLGLLAILILRGRSADVLAWTLLVIALGRYALTVLAGLRRLR